MCRGCVCRDCVCRDGTGRDRVCGLLPSLGNSSTDWSLTDLGSDPSSVTYYDMALRRLFNFFKPSSLMYKLETVTLSGHKSSMKRTSGKSVAHRRCSISPGFLPRPLHRCLGLTHGARAAWPVDCMGQQMEGEACRPGPGRSLAKPWRRGGEWKAAESEEETKLDLAQTQHTWRTGGGDPRSERHGGLTVRQAQLGA